MGKGQRVQEWHHWHPHLALRSPHSHELLRQGTMETTQQCICSNWHELLWLKPSQVSGAERGQNQMDVTVFHEKQPLRGSLCLLSSNTKIFWLLGQDSQ